MARERKPLIEPGSMLPAIDTLSRILERDRAASGRRGPEVGASPVAGTAAEPEASAAPPPPQDVRPPATEVQASADDANNITSNITAHTRGSASENMRSNAGNSEEAQLSAQVTARPSTKKGGKLDASATAREGARQHARRMADSRAIPITLRMPEDLNDWLDEYAHAHRKQGVKKQDLIARAVQLLVVELSAGEGEGDAD